MRMVSKSSIIISVWASSFECHVSRTVRSSTNVHGEWYVVGSLGGRLRSTQLSSEDWFSHVCDHAITVLE